MCQYLHQYIHDCDALGSLQNMQMQVQPGKRADCGQIWGVIAQRNTAVNLDVQEYAQILVVLSGTDPIYTNPPAAPTRQESGTSWIRVDPVDSLFSVVQTQFQF